MIKNVMKQTEMISPSPREALATSTRQSPSCFRAHPRRAVRKWFCAAAFGLALLGIANSGLCASWYVDNAASGANNGTSWASAWTSFSSIVWGSSGVKAGDTLYISGGSSSQTYTSGLSVGASGTSASRITIAVGQDAGHNGTVILSGVGINC